MEGLEEWEKLEIDDLDFLGTLHPHSHSSPILTILPAKRPPPPTDAILNRLKKQNASQTLNPIPILSIPHQNPLQNPPKNPLQNPPPLQQSQLPRRPNLRPNNQNNENQEEVRIRRVFSFPGPAGAVQRALHKKVEDGRGFGDDKTGGIRSSSNSRLEDDDVDFKEAAWLSAIDYLHRENNGCSEAKFSAKQTIGFIKKRGNIDRIPQVLGIIKTCTPNKLGSMLVTLKDPTGTVGGSINHRVMRDSEFGRDISVGAVLLLRQVGVFSPTPSESYLNITITNVEKVFKKGNSFPERQDGASTSKNRGRQDGASTSKNRSSLPPEMFKEAGNVRLSTNGASQQDGIFSSKQHEATNHSLHSRLIDKNVTATQNAGFHQQHHFTIDNNLEGRKAPPQEDNSQQRLTHENISPTKIPYNKNNVLKVMSSEQDPHTGTDSTSENVKVCSSKKESIPVTIDWNDEVELLMADGFDLFD